MEAEDKLAHEREERRQLFKDIHRYEEEGKVTDAYLEAVTQGFGRSRRTNRLAKIIELAGDASQVLDISNIDIMLYDFDDTFGNVPDALIETMLQPHGMETLRRRMEFADKVVARLHEDFPGMMAELPSNLLQAEGPEGQPGPGARAGRYRGIRLKREKPV